MTLLGGIPRVSTTFHEFLRPSHMETFYTFYGFYGNGTKAGVRSRSWSLASPS